MRLQPQLRVSQMPFVHVMFILAVTACCLYHSYRRREKITCMAGMMIAMITAMISSLSIGHLLGILDPSNLERSSIAAAAFGMAVGFLSGKPVSLMAAMDGMAAGIMGGMMGVMLGVMLPGPGWMVWFLDLIVSLMSVMVFLLIREEETSYESWRNQHNNEEKEADR